MNPIVPRGAHLLPVSGRFQIFEDYARYQPECGGSGSDRYQITVERRVGGTLFASDTLELRAKFEAWVRKRRGRDKRMAGLPWRVWDSLTKRATSSGYRTEESATRAARRMNGNWSKRYEARRAK